MSIRVAFGPMGSRELAHWSCLVQWGAVNEHIGLARSNGEPRISTLVVLGLIGSRGLAHK
jgi:hypothetical protein